MPFQFNGELATAVVNKDIELATGVEQRLEAWLANEITVTNITGNAATATALATPRAINGVDFDGTAPITVTADANTLSGTTLKSTVVNSSLTSVGTLTHDLTIGDTLILTGDSVSHVSNNTNSGREILQLRGKTTLSTGAGINIYGDGDSSNADKVIIFGGSSTPKLTVTSSGVAVGGALSKTSGSFDIPHPTKGGDWRLRHSFIEGPTCDNIYRGTVTLSGGSATVDLDAVSNMTDGTWQALNINPWTLVSSSGNAVTWSLSGKILTINGPDEAVCNWMVIGERKDPAIIESSISDSNGKLVVEYEDASFATGI